MTRLVQGLERDGLVARDDDPGDRRVVHLRATAAGRRVLEAGRRRRIAALVHQLAALPATERELLDRAAAVLERIARAPADPDD
jgi:DNA-binding MarR family transcriptional regulator